MESYLNISKLLIIMNLDAYDKKILFALDQNARESYIQLAKKAGLSKDTVKYRINNYLKSNLLGGFHTLIDSSKLGFYSFRTYFSFNNTTNEDEIKILEFLKQEKNIFYLFQAEGTFDIGFGYFAKSIKEFNDFVNVFEEQFPKITIQEKGIFISLQHFNRNYLINKKRIQIPKKILQEPNKIKIDATDKQILKIISNNARIQIIDLAKKINLTSKAIIYRIKNLEKNKIILGYKSKLNLEKINYSMYKIDLKIKNKNIIKNIKSHISQLPNIIHSEEVFEGSNVEFDIECKNYTEFENIIKKIKEKYGKEIENIKHYRTIKIIKTTYYPEE